MNRISLITICLLLLIVSACSSGGGNTVTPDLKSTPQMDNEPFEEFYPMESSDVLYTSTSGDITAYKAFGIFDVHLDFEALSAELIPARNAQKIGDTFDADLTQFLTVTPCANCLQITGVTLLNANQVQVGFAVKHPFKDITKRPDLHGFDVRGIVLAKGNYNFPQMSIQTGATSSTPARANVSLIANPEGFTYHFDSLAADTHYFDPPRNYDATINPFRRYFVNQDTGAFNPQSPIGHNVMATGCNWETQNYVFNMPTGATIVDFAFIVDVAYGHSATFQNRQSPFYFLPEYNRKEAWSVGVMINANNFKSGDTSSTAQLQVFVKDWQAGLTADTNYPDTNNLGGIKAESDVASVMAYIPLVSNVVQVTTPATGDGSPLAPYRYDLTLTNNLGASAFDYYGIVAVRDDLQGQQGPYGIPENPNGFPYAGPEIYDYSVYSIFPIRVYGGSPDVTDFSYPDKIYENEAIQLTAVVNEPDGDAVTYLWEQTAPGSPMGRFVDPSVKNATWIPPDVNDIPEEGLDVTLRLKATDADGFTWHSENIKVLERNSPPVCDGITRDPYYGVTSINADVNLIVTAHDPDGDSITYEWDYNYNGLTFDVDGTGADVLTKWDNGGYYTVACRIKEVRTNPKSTICTTNMLVEGPTIDAFKIDNATAPPSFQLQDMIYSNNKYHFLYMDMDDLSLYYCNGAGNPPLFRNHRKIVDGTEYDQIRSAHIAGYGNTIHISWVGHKPLHLNTDLNIITSTNGGTSFDGLGGMRQIISLTTPNGLTYADICIGRSPMEYFAMFQARIGLTGPYGCFIHQSTDNGETWTQPLLGSFRGVDSTAEVSNPSITVAGGTIHAMWHDTNSEPKYLYDWSTDGGATWHADVTVSDTAVGAWNLYGCLAAGTDGRPHFAWADSNGMLYYRKLTSHVPPTLTDINTIRPFATTHLSGLDIFVSPSSDAILVPFSYWTSNPVSMYTVALYKSIDAGSSFELDGIEYSSSPGLSGVQCDGVYFNSPNRIELLNAWTFGDDSKGNIYGAYYYIAERF